MKKMRAKNLLVSFCTLALLLMSVATVAAFGTSNSPTASDVVDTYDIKVQGIIATTTFSTNNSVVSVIADDEVLVEVFFTAYQDDTDVTVEVEIDGSKVKTRSISENFDVEAGKSYRKLLAIQVPSELKDEVSDDLTLEIEVDGKDYKSNLAPITLRVQRPSYNPVVMSVETPSSITAGETFPVEIVLKNLGYNDLDDVYVSARIVGLGVSQAKYFGDIENLENRSSHHHHHDEDTAVGSLYLKVPYNTIQGVYTLEVIVDNDDVRTVETREIVIGNEFSNTLVPVKTSETVAVGQDAVYEFMIVNPTNNVKVYTIVTESNSALSTTASHSVVAVPAGSSQKVQVTANAEKEGSQNFVVTVLSADELVGAFDFDLNVEGKAANNSIVVLTIVLAIIFLVLLVVLIVLLGKKPEKTEDFGESYY